MVFSLFLDPFGPPQGRDKTGILLMKVGADVTAKVGGMKALHKVGGVREYGMNWANFKPAELEDPKDIVKSKIEDK